MLIFVSGHPTSCRIRNPPFPKFETRQMTAASSTPEDNAPSVFYRVASAVFYGFASILIVFVNKILLTNLRFPSFVWVGIGQMFATILILGIARYLKIVNFPRLDRSIPHKIFPLPLFFVFNLVSGLGGTQKTNLPMFTVLRRFSILMTMLLEWGILGSKPSFSVRCSVFLIIFGSFVAALYDLAFDLYGYSLIMVNNVCTATSGVLVKKKLDAKELGKWGLMYYNSLFMLGPLLILAYTLGENDRVADFIVNEGLTVPVVLCFLLSAVCGFILNFALIQCTHYNSALTTTCVGPIKNLFVTYVGMFSSGDYVFQWVNFLGVNISVAGSILYTYVTFRRKKSPITRSIIAKPVEKERLLP